MQYAICNNAICNFNAIIYLHATFFPKIILPFFRVNVVKLRVSLRMKMGAIIRLECFIKTKNPEIQYKISLFSRL
jgi:hypothetical protein